MNNERLDLTSRDAWIKNNVPKLLQNLGFVETLRSVKALTDFIDQNNIPDVKVTKFLQPLATAFLGRVKPPLPKLRGSSLHLSSSHKK
jgi:hypothetical protein